MPNLSLEALFRPRSIAVVGASEDPSRIGGRPIAYLKKFGFTGQIWGVNPKYKTVQGQPCVPTAAELPQVDLAIIAVPAEAAVAQFEEACKIGVRAATIFSGGFAESGPRGRKLQERLRDLANSHRVALNGPNCAGFASFVHRTYATFATSLATLPQFQVGHVALLSQSGGFATNPYVDGVLAGARFSHFITTGNEASLDYCDYLEYLLEDPETHAVIGYAESISDGTRFCSLAANMREAGKPLVFLKAGGTPAGVESVASHSGRMAGNDAAFDAACRRYGVIRVEGLEDMVDLARLLSGRAVRRGLAVASTSGGATVYIGDLAERMGVRLAEFGPTLIDKLRAIIPEFATAHNPLDLTGQVITDPSLLRRSLAVLLGEEGVGCLLVFLSGQEDSAADIVETLSESLSVTNKALLVAWAGTPPRVRDLVSQLDIPVYADPARALRSLSLLLPGDRHATRAATSSSGQGRVSGEWEAMELLQTWGVPVPAHWRVASDSDVARVARATHYPCVLKMLEPLVAHRSDIGAVITNILDPEQLEAAWRQLQHRHAASVALVAEQASPGIEMLVGFVRDPTFGYRVVLGEGGIWANEIHDAVTLIPPLDADYVLREMAALRLWPVLAGGHGQPAQAIEVLADGVLKIAALFEGVPSLQEFECNPVLIRPDGITVVDALGVSAEADLSSCYAIR